MESYPSSASVSASPPTSAPKLVPTSATSSSSLICKRSLRVIKRTRFAYDITCENAYIFVQHMYDKDMKVQLCAWEIIKETIQQKKMDICKPIIQFSLAYIFKFQENEMVFNFLHLYLTELDPFFFLEQYYEHMDSTKMNILNRRYTDLANLDLNFINSFLKETDKLRIGNSTKTFLRKHIALVFKIYERSKENDDYDIINLISQLFVRLIQLDHIVLMLVKNGTWFNIFLNLLKTNQTLPSDFGPLNPVKEQILINIRIKIIKPTSAAMDSNALIELKKENDKEVYHYISDNFENILKSVFTKMENKDTKKEGILFLHKIISFLASMDNLNTPLSRKDLFEKNTRWRNALKKGKKSPIVQPPNDLMEYTEIYHMGKCLIKAGVFDYLGEILSNPDMECFKHIVFEIMDFLVCIEGNVLLKNFMPLKFLPILFQQLNDGNDNLAIKEFLKKLLYKNKEDSNNFDKKVAKLYIPALLHCFMVNDDIEVNVTAMDILTSCLQTYGKQIESLVLLDGLDGTKDFFDRILKLLKPLASSEFQLATVQFITKCVNCEILKNQFRQSKVIEKLGSILKPIHTRNKLRALDSAIYNCSKIMSKKMWI